MSLIGVLALAAAGAVGGGFWLAQRSQKMTPPGLVEGRLAPCPGAPNCVSSEDGAVSPLPPVDSMRLQAVMAALGADLQRAEENYLAFTTRSRLFGFVDDVEFRLTPEATHIRSASRVGYSDMGANRRRVEAIRAALAHTP